LLKKKKRGGDNLSLCPATKREKLSLLHFPYLHLGGERKWEDQHLPRILPTKGEKEQNFFSQGESFFPTSIFTGEKKVYLFSSYLLGRRQDIITNNSGRAEPLLSSSLSNKKDTSVAFYPFCGKKKGSEERKKREERQMLHYQTGKKSQQRKYPSFRRKMGLLAEKRESFSSYKRKKKGALSLVSGGKKSATLPEVLSSLFSLP